MGIMRRVASEWAYLTGSLRALRRSGAVLKRPNETGREFIEQIGRRFGERIALVSQQESYSYQQLDARTNQYARFLLSKGLVKGDRVILLMPNRAEYIAAWMGTIKAGCVSAWLNTGLTGASLAHCIAITEAKIAIVDATLMPVFNKVRSNASTSMEVYVYGACEDCVDPRLDQIVSTMSAAPLVGEERPDMTIEDRAIYVFTSGTTGLPKAANINHSRLLRIIEGFSGAINAVSSDKMYIPLPLYHTTGGVCAVGAVLSVGGTANIAEKFSVRNFWSDIISGECTIFVYVGELCRYLISAPGSPQEHAHKLRMCFGNGLRAEVFEQVQKRFGIRHVLEFYSATEGNISLFNFDSTVGAVGRIPKWAENRYRVKIVKYNSEKGEPERGPDGFCVECPFGDVGEVIGQIINNPRNPANKFDGYIDKVATEKKILRDAFAKGDAWFRSGDLMKRDAAGYFYFLDRIGDTYRWKGENVSTGEVTAAITSFAGIEDANVYGVTIRGLEGRAGMAAIALPNAAGLDLQRLRTHISERLPEFARPIFLRVQQHIDLTGTFKQRKTDLVELGFDPVRTTDPLFFNDPRSQSYLRIDEKLFQEIQSGQIRL